MTSTTRAHRRNDHVTIFQPGLSLRFAVNAKRRDFQFMRNAGKT